MNIATLALAASAAFAQPDTTGRNGTIYTHDTYRAPVRTVSDSVRGPVEHHIFDRHDSTHLEAHLPHPHHAKHLPFSLHRNRLSGMERNFPYEHLAAGIHFERKHFDLEINIIKETEPHGHGHENYLRRAPGIGFVVSYHR